MSNNRESTFLANLERRKAGRVRCSQMLCQLGPIADLSRGGCRVISKKPISIPEGKSVILHMNVAGMALSIPAQQVSCRARRDGKHDVGFRFIAVSDDARRELMNVLRAALAAPEHLQRMSA